MDLKCFRKSKVKLSSQSIPISAKQLLAILKDVDLLQCVNIYEDVEAKLLYIRHTLYLAAKNNEPDILKRLLLIISQTCPHNKLAEILLYEEEKSPLDYCFENNEREGCKELIKCGAYIPDGLKGKKTEHILKDKNTRKTR